MRVFTQFHTAQEHEQFLQNLQKERELKMRISELARYRRNGLTRHEECAHFEQERVQHEEWKEKRSVSNIFVAYNVRIACSLWGQTLVAWIQATLSSRGKTEQWILMSTPLCVYVCVRACVRPFFPPSSSSSSICLHCFISPKLCWIMGRGCSAWQKFKKYKVHSILADKCNST